MSQPNAPGRVEMPVDDELCSGADDGWYARPEHGGPPTIERDEVFTSGGEDVGDLGGDFGADGVAVCGGVPFGPLMPGRPVLVDQNVDESASGMAHVDEQPDHRWTIPTIAPSVVNGPEESVGSSPFAVECLAYQLIAGGQQSAADRFVAGECGRFTGTVVFEIAARGVRQGRIRGEVGEPATAFLR